MTLYRVQAQTETQKHEPNVGTWVGSISSPTFYLDSNVQGIVSEDHAERIVRDWLTDLGLPIASIVVLAER